MSISALYLFSVEDHFSLFIICGLIVNLRPQPFLLPKKGKTLKPLAIVNSTNCWISFNIISNIFWRRQSFPLFPIGFTYLEFFALNWQCRLNSACWLLATSSTLLLSQSKNICLLFPLYDVCELMRRFYCSIQPLVVQVLELLKLQEEQHVTWPEQRTTPLNFCFLL